MEKSIIPSIKEKIIPDFLYFPSFAHFILHHEFENFVKEIIHLYDETDIPILRFFHSMSPDKREALVMASNREMLTLIASNNTLQYIEKTISNWFNDQLSLITPDQVHSQDITLVNYIKRKAFRQFIPHYTDDPMLWLNIIEELDRFTVILDSELFSSYIKSQQQKINSINTALQKREQQLLEAQAIGQIGSFEWDFQGKQSSYTPEIFKIFEMEGPGNLNSFLDFVHPEDRKKVKKAFDNAMQDGNYECEYRYVKNNNEKIIFSRGKVQFEGDKPARMIGTITDVTEHHTIISKLQESEKLHKQAQALTHIGNWSWVIHEDRITWSDEIYRIYGLEPQSEEITYERFLSFIHPEDKENSILEIQKSLETLQVREYHFRITTPNGLGKVLLGKGEIVADQNNKPLIMLGTCQDVTREFMLNKELKEREKYLQELNQSLQFANHELSRTNKELESFNFIASHDLQEPLRKIQLYSNRIIENGFGDLPAQLKDYFGKIINASNRMQMLIEDFLSFSQTFNTTQAAEKVDLNQMLEEVKMELSNRIEEKHAIIKTSRLPSVFAIPFQIKQLLTNLISNALKYTDPEVQPRITLTGTTVKGNQIPVEGARSDKAYTKISVADNGIGFDEKYSSKIFGLFQRLHSKSVYSGTGIGLALCKKIVENLDGYITAESKPGKGSVFTFYIPVQKSKKDQFRE